MDLFIYTYMRIGPTKRLYSSKTYATKHKVYEN